STAEYSHHLERPNHQTGHARPGHLIKILLRALKRSLCLVARQREDVGAADVYAQLSNCGAWIGDYLNGGA
ncbi:hypothetical protein, partial [Streptomyces goshikiensis]|uniref:hypothetical protein n=1 Tax=Streptomyces goshikiensis TaxID=1942 RepID=UPI003319F80C